MNILDKLRKLGKPALRKGAVLLSVLIALLFVSRPVFAKTTYVITDGNRVFTYESFATDPAAVLTEAGLRLDEYDTFTSEASFGATALTVQRSQTITVHLAGETVTAESYGETVDELLHRLNIYPGEHDILSLPGDTQTWDGMELTIDTVLRETQTYTAAIPHAVSYYYDDSMPLGEEKVLTRGVDGEMRCTANVTYVNGCETQREVTEQKVIHSPVEELIAVGTGNALAVAEAEEASDKVIMGSGGDLVTLCAADLAGFVIGDGTITLPTGEVLTYTHTTQVKASAYNHQDEGCDMITSTGTTVHVGTVAVDPRFIPYGTRMFIVSNDGAYIYGIAVAEDCGGAIKEDRVDLYFPTLRECFDFGRRSCTVYFLG